MLDQLDDDITNIVNLTSLVFRRFSYIAMMFVGLGACVYDSYKSMQKLPAVKIDAVSQREKFLGEKKTEKTNKHRWWHYFFLIIENFSYFEFVLTPFLLLYISSHFDSLRCLIFHIILFENNLFLYNLRIFLNFIRRKNGKLRLVSEKFIKRIYRWPPKVPIFL